MVFRCVYALTSSLQDSSYLEENSHGSNDALLLDGSSEAVKVIGIVQVDLHL